MLIDDAHRYVALRRSLRFKLGKTARRLAAFTRHAVDHGDSHILTSTALAWRAAVSSTPDTRYRRLQEIAGFARSCMPRTRGTRYHGIICIIVRARDPRRISTRRTNWSGCLMPPRLCGVRSRSRSDGTSTRC